jgi:hypothetical protein
VTGLTAGTRVYVVSTFWGYSIGDIVSVGDECTDVPLQFPLAVGDSLTLELVRCGHWRSVAAVATVQSAPRVLPAPDCRAARRHGRNDYRRGTCAGCVSAMSNSSMRRGRPTVCFLVSQAVTRSESSIGVPPLPAGHARTRCRQRLCSRLSRPSIVVKTGDRPLKYKPGSADRIVALTGTRRYGHAAAPL